MGVGVGVYFHVYCDVCILCIINIITITLVYLVPFILVYLFSLSHEGRDSTRVRLYSHCNLHRLFQLMPNGKVCAEKMQ